MKSIAFLLITGFWWLLVDESKAATLLRLNKTKTKAEIRISEEEQHFAKVGEKIQIELEQEKIVAIAPGFWNVVA